MALNGANLGVVINLAAAFTSTITVPAGTEAVVRPDAETAAELEPPQPTHTGVPLTGFTRDGQHR